MEYPQYTYPVEALYTGASFGNYYAFARLDEQTNLRGLWSSIDNQYYVGEWNIDVLVDGKSPVAKDTIFYPESQTTTFVDDQITIEKQFFIPFLSDQHSREDSIELRSAIFLIRLMNRSSKPTKIFIRHEIYFPANRCDRFTKQAPADQTEKRVDILKREQHCEICTVGVPNEVQIFGSTIPWNLCEGNDKTLLVEYRISLQAHQDIEIPFVMSFSSSGSDQALATFQRCLQAKGLLQRSIQSYGDILSRSLVFTPNQVINRGMQWAKVNTVRVQHRYRIGEGFTNDPPQDIIVIRDLAWYVLGSDYLTPKFSRCLLALAERYGFHEDGKLTEYIHADEHTPILHDYKLNINDDTPLYVVALYHHALTCDDDFSLEYVYPLVKRACDYIISQIDEGLVRCYAEGTNVWGICSWRNIIDGYNLTGAVTEINAECYYALKIASEVAEQLGKKDDASKYGEAAEGLKQAINEKLVSEKNGMYLLNLDNNGNRHHDVTGDLIFPVFFDVANEKQRTRILEQLTRKDMWTPYGIRTVSKQEKNYDPDFGCQLVGGIWHNLTAWIAYCIRKEVPDKLAEGMLNIYRLCEIERPRDFQNVVPGQFPERLHGETFQSRGMTMSPWMSPTYFWLGVEGLLGVKSTLQGLEINPVLPANWNWIAVKNLLYKGKSINAFFYDGKLYSTHQVTSSYPVNVGNVIETVADNDKIFSIALNVGNEICLFVAADQHVRGNVKLMYEAAAFEKFVELTLGEALLFRIPIKQIVSHSQRVVMKGSS